MGPDPAGPAGPVTRFPEIRAARTLENSLYLVVMALWAIHFLALYRALRGLSLAPALSGGVLGIVGLTVLAAGALPHVATTRLSDLYHAPGATPQDQATVAFLWQANQGMFDALLAVGLVLLLIGIVGLGVAMLGSPAFGRGIGATTVALGVIGIGAASALLLDPLSPCSTWRKEVAPLHTTADEWDAMGKCASLTLLVSRREAGGGFPGRWTYPAV